MTTPRTSEPRKTAPAIDRAKLRAAIRKMGDEYVFYMLDDAIEALPPATLAKIAGQYIQLDRLRPDPARSKTRASEIDDVTAFDAAARRGEYYVGFNVNSKNFMQLSTGTRAFVADCRRLLDRCVAQSTKGRCACPAFGILAALLRYVDEGNDDVVFFADEGGSWQVVGDWAKIFPAWFKCLAKHADPDEFAGVTAPDRCSNAGVCRAPVGLGAWCDAATPCMSGTVCDAYACRIVVGAGAACPDGFTTCASGLACVQGTAPGHGTCQAVPGSGQGCLIDGRCADGFTCTSGFGTFGVCEPSICPTGDFPI
jgi:hypothetical protein